MEYLPPESEPKEGPPPILEYAAPDPKHPRQTPFYVRGIALMMSALALLMGLSCGCGSICEWIDYATRWKTSDLPADDIRFFVVSGILIVVGGIGIRAALKVKSSGK